LVPEVALLLVPGGEGAAQMQCGREGLEGPLEGYGTAVLELPGGLGAAAGGRRRNLAQYVTPVGGKSREAEAVESAVLGRDSSSLCPAGGAALAGGAPAMPAVLGSAVQHGKHGGRGLHAGPGGLEFLELLHQAGPVRSGLDGQVSTVAEVVAGPLLPDDI